MSGGFFRGTSADQDTRFSNKQAKLLKSQKFAPELEHLVDMRKVKMDVIRPWIANRVTELLGFEDEVLINFIYGLLEPKEVNGKEVQIQLTGFMEKNTVKFMKELWALLLSAQKNESGVPQQFLDAKEAETRKKQAEVDRITSEIQKKKEKESKELESERSKKMDGGVETESNVGAVEADMESSLKGSRGDNEDDKEANNRNGVRRRNRYSTSPRSTHRSSSSPQSKSTSRSPEAKRKSISSERAYCSPRRSISPRRRYSSRAPRSPTRRTSSYTGQRSRSSSRRRSPSPVRRRLRSPFRRRSPSPVRRRRSPSPLRRRRSPSPLRRRRSPSPIRRRRSPSPIRRRRSPPPLRRRGSPSPLRGRSPSPMSPRSPSPVRRRSPSLVRHRSISPVYDRSPSPLRRRSRSRSPVWHRSPLSVRRRSRSPSPIRHRSPLSIGRRSRSPSPRRRSPSPLRRRYDRAPSTPDRGSPSPSTPRRGSPSPRHRYPIPARTRSPVHSSRRSYSPYGSSSPSPDRCRSPSPMRRPLKEYRSPMRSPEERLSKREKMHRPSAYLRSPQRDAKDRKSLRGKLSSLSSPPERSRIQLQSPVSTRARLANEERRSPSPHESTLKQRGRKNRFSGSSESPVRERRDQSRHDDSLSPQQKLQKQKPKRATPESTKEYEDPDHARGYKSRSALKREDSPVKVPTKDNNSSEKVAVHKTNESRSCIDNKDSKKKDHEMTSDKGSRKGVYSSMPDGRKSPTSFGERPHAFYTGEGQKYEDSDRLHLNNFNDDRSHRSEIKQTSGENIDRNNGGGAFDSGSEENGKHRTENKGKRKHERSHREEMASDDYSSDSEIEDKKEAKRRRRKEEKKLRKEEKRRRHEERRRRREERRTEKMKRKDIKDSHSSDDEHAEDTQLEQKELEIELRKKALESLKAKKGINH